LGGLGGLVHAIVFGQNRLRIPRRVARSKYWDLSFVGDIFVGMVGAAITLQTISPSEFSKVVSISVLAGFGGGSVLGNYRMRSELQLEREKSRSLAEIVER